MVHMSFDIKLDKTDVELWMNEFLDIAQTINRIDPSKAKGQEGLILKAKEVDSEYVLESLLIKVQLLLNNGAKADEVSAVIQHMEEVNFCATGQDEGNGFIWRAIVLKSMILKQS